MVQVDHGMVEQELRDKEKYKLTFCFKSYLAAEAAFAGTEQYKH